MVQRVFFLGLGRVEDVDEPVGAGGEEERSVGGVELQRGDGVGVGFD